MNIELTKEDIEKYKEKFILERLEQLNTYDMFNNLKQSVLSKYAETSYGRQDYYLTSEFQNKLRESLDKDIGEKANAILEKNYKSILEAKVKQWFYEEIDKIFDFVLKDLHIFSTSQDHEYREEEYKSMQDAVNSAYEDGRRDQ